MHVCVYYFYSIYFLQTRKKHIHISVTIDISTKQPIRQDPFSLFIRFSNESFSTRQEHAREVRDPFRSRVFRAMSNFYLLRRHWGSRPTSMENYFAYHLKGAKNRSTSEEAREHKALNKSLWVLPSCAIRRETRLLEFSNRSRRCIRRVNTAAGDVCVRFHGEPFFWGVLMARPLLRRDGTPICKTTCLMTKESRTAPCLRSINSGGRGFGFIYSFSYRWYRTE